MSSELIEKVKNALAALGLADQKTPVVAAFSGGPDSVCLTDVLTGLGYTVGIAHVNHHLRENADRDAAFAAEFAKSRALPYVIKDVGVRSRVEKTHESVEEAARALRYEALLNAAKELFPEGAVIATAHQKNDQAETLLFRLIRGSDLRGLGGIPMKNGVFVRPLLSVSREEIEAYLKEKKLPFVTDETNLTPSADRNKLRLQALPGLESVRKDAVEKLGEAADLFHETDAYLQNEAENRLLSAGLSVEEGVLTAPAALFADEAPLMRRYLVRGILEKLDVPLKDQTRAHYQALSELFLLPVGRELRLPGGGRAVRTYDGVRFEKEAAAAEEPLPACPTLKTRRILPEEAQKNVDFPYTKRFDCAKINENQLEVRFRRPGDRIAISGGHKSLQDFFVDEKVPRERRDRIPVVAAGADVLWIVGYRVSEAHRVTDETTEILEVTIEGVES